MSVRLTNRALSSMTRPIPIVRLHSLFALALAAALGACDAPPAEPRPTPPAPGEVFTAEDGTRFTVEVVASNLEIPWDMAFAHDGRLFFTERPGRVRIFAGGRVMEEPALVLDDVEAQGEGGLLGMTLHPRFFENGFVYLAYTARAADGRLINRVARYREVLNRLEEGVVLLDDIPGATIHNGSRVRFGPDGALYVTTGDAADPMIAQDLQSIGGKILRLREDGTRPDDNPFGTLIFSYGHRNTQGIDWHPLSGELWQTEHGPVGDDEVNRIVAGANYGWPLIQGHETRPGMETPVLVFTPSVAPSGASFYTGNALPAFRNNFFFATLRGGHIHRVRFDPQDNRTVIANERLLENRYGRLRHVIGGPDGYLYFCTNNRDGRGTPEAEDDRILRIVPVGSVSDSTKLPATVEGGERVPEHIRQEP
jgi:aldose sugar dehydrogenase